MRRIFFVPCLALLLFCVSSFKTSSPSGGDGFNVNSPDYDRLNSLVLEKINLKRESKSETPLEFSASLQKTALYFTRDLRLRKFEQLRNERKVLMQKVRLLSWKNGYTNTMLNVVITQQNAVNFGGGKFYHDRDDTETNSRLFYGDAPSKAEKKKPDFTSRPIKDFSYDELAEIIAKQFLLDKRIFKCLNSGYSLVGCSCYLEKKTVNRKRIPILKAIFILGGKRLNF